MKVPSIYKILENAYQTYNQVNFIADDPISIPHQYVKKADIEIAGLFAAVFAWGQRITIINKTQDVLQRMDNSPHDFVLNHQEKDLKKMLDFKHRTFNDTDLLYFIHFLKHHYQTEISLESAFSRGMKKKDVNIENGLMGFRDYFFSLPDAPARTRKHIASPSTGSSCKRLNMFLRWMVRKDKFGVDFGIWETIKPAQLVCPLDIHVGRVARKLGLLERAQDDWQAAVALTNALKRFDPKDPVKYDLALFGLGVNGEH